MKGLYVKKVTEPDVHITFNHGTAFLIAHDEENYSHYEMEVIGPEGKINFQTWEILLNIGE